MGGRLIFRSAPDTGDQCLARDLADEGLLKSGTLMEMRAWVRGLGVREAVRAAATVLGIERLERDAGRLMKAALGTKRMPGTQMVGLVLKSGEGSRGGKIVGHTRSGKPLYAPAHGQGLAALHDGLMHHAGTHNFDYADHVDAAAHHAVAHQTHQHEAQTAGRGAWATAANQSKGPTHQELAAHFAAHPEAKKQRDLHRDLAAQHHAAGVYHEEQMGAVDRFHRRKHEHLRDFHQQEAATATSEEERNYHGARAHQHAEEVEHPHHRSVGFSRGAAHIPEFAKSKG